MPIYEYECSECGQRFDRLQKLSDPDPTDCAACGRPTLRRRITAPAFRLAGAGWYETDFKKDGDKKRNLAEGAGDGKPAEASKPEPAKTEAAPAPASSPAADKPAGGGAG
jgi:putative FmdB family regulatory protein